MMNTHCIEMTRSLFDSHHLSDIILNFVDDDDDDDQLEIKSHKFVLCTNSPYFNTLFSGKFINGPIIKIKVFNIYVAYDVIKSFYYYTDSNVGNLSEDEHLFEYIACCDFFDLKTDRINCLSTIKIPANKFESIYDT